MIDTTKMLLLLAILALGAFVGYDYWKSSDEPPASAAPAPASAEPQAGKTEAAKEPAPSAAVAVTPASLPKAGIFRYRDEKGVINYTNVPSSIPDTQRTKAELVELPVVTELDREFVKRHTSGKPMPANAMAVDAKAPKIRLFMIKWCPHSRKVAELLEQLGAEFVKYDVGEDMWRLNELLSLTAGRPRVPVLMVGETMITGFKPDDIRREIAAFTRK